MPTKIDDLIRLIRTYNPDSDTSSIERAYQFARNHHAGQKRLSGGDYIDHPLEVARLLAERRGDKAGARAAYDQLIKNHPKSDEAALARDRLKAIGR